MTIEDLKENINKFSWQQMLSNSDGKTSSTGVCGVITILIGLLCFIYGCIDFSYISNKNDIIFYSSGIITLGASLLGVRKLSTGPSVSDEVVKLSDTSQTIDTSTQINS